MALRTAASFGSHVATMVRPTDNGDTPSSRSRATNAGDGGSARGVSSFLAGLKRRAPFSATTWSNSSSWGNTR